MAFAFRDWGKASMRPPGLDHIVEFWKSSIEHFPTVLLEAIRDYMAIAVSDGSSKTNGEQQLG